MDDLTPAERRAFRARAHALHPVVIIGESGLSTAVFADIERNLNYHELIKVRVLGAGRDTRETWLSLICERAGAHPVQHMGRTLVIYRKNPQPPPPVEKPASKKKTGRRPVRVIDLRAAARQSDPHITPPRRPRFERETRRKPRPR